MPLLLGIDIGTTNWKAAAFDEEGNMVAIKKTPAVTNYDAQGRGYYNPDTVWSCICGIVKQLLEELRGTEGVVAVSVTSMGEAMIPIDSRGEPSYHAIAWFDTQAVQQASFVEELTGRERLFSITGLDPNPVFSLCKMLWLRENEPEAYAKTKMWLSMTDFIYLKLSGEFATDTTIASRTLMMDLKNRNWSQQILDTYNIDRNHLPQICKSGTVIGKVLPRASTESGLMQGIPVVTGGHDHLCASLASGVLPGSCILDSSGTAESLIGISKGGMPVPERFEGLRIGSYLDPSHFATWGGIIASGASIDWGMRNFASLEGWGISNTALEYSYVDDKVAGASPGANGLMYLPHIRGCGAPEWDPAARGAFIGLRSNHTPQDIMRAIMEGLCYQARIILEYSEKVMKRPITEIHTVGGGARSSIWQQIKADITGRKVEIPCVEEATVMGAALLAGIGTGVYKDMEEATRRTYRVKKRFVPNGDLQALYNTRYEIFQELYPLLKQINRRLSQG